MSELGKPFPKKIRSRKKTENQSLNAACEQNHYRGSEIWFKQKKTKPRMNYEWIGKTI